MQSSNQTQYTITLAAGDDVSTINFYSPAITDAFVLGLAETLRGVQWPAGVTAQVTAIKATTEIQSYSTDLTQASPVFS